MTTPARNTVSERAPDQQAPRPALGLRPVPRFSRTFAFMLCVYTIWALGVLVVHTYNSSVPASQHLDLCPMKLAADIPCPMCGGTRAVARLASLDPAGALYRNPLVSLFAPIAAGLILLRLATGRVVQVSLGPTSRRAAWGLATAAMLLNWAWVNSIGN